MRIEDVSERKFYEIECAKNKTNPNTSGWVSDNLTTNYVLMKKSREEILKAIKLTLKTIVPDAKVILFGSRARGDAKADSDWDILIILDKPKVEPTDFDNISYPLYELGWQEDEHFSAKLYTKSEWLKRSFTPFYKNVEKEGILI